MNDLMERLREHAPQTVIEALTHVAKLVAYAHEHGYHEIGYDPVAVLADALQLNKPADLETLRAENAKLREALRRFANIRAGDGDVFSRYDPRTIIRCEVTVVDLLAARAALAAKEGEQ